MTDESEARMHAIEQPATGLEGEERLESPSSLGRSAPAETVATNQQRLVAPLSELAEKWEDYLRVVEGKAPATRKDYLASVRRFLADSGASAPEAITLEAIERHVKRRSYGGAGPSRIASTIIAVRLFCRYLVAHGLLATNPATSIPTPRRYRSAIKVLTVPEVRRLLFGEKPGVLPRDRKELISAAMFAVQYGGALRPLELATLRTEDVDWKEKERSFVVLVRRGKHARGDVHQWLGPEVSHFLGGYLRERGKLGPGPYLFPGVGARAMSAHTIWRRFQELAAQRGIEAKGRLLSAKILRTSRGTHLAEQGKWSPRKLQAFMRHASVDTTMTHYVWVDEDSLGRMLMRHDPLKKQRVERVTAGGVFQNLLDGLGGVARVN